SLRGFSGSEQWIAWLCPNGFGGSIFMDWVAPPPWNTHLLGFEKYLIQHIHTLHFNINKYQYPRYPSIFKN
ncbi:hypothetical protein ACTM8V_08995, partial [Holdemanella porci]|uniref:hypothetical protein n=1 Tax=Holdemanella porci TaxID=2652276 RepID=UPI003F896150